MRRCITHCGSCHRHFTSDSAFEAHRTMKEGATDYDRECRDPYELVDADTRHILIEATNDGICDMYAITQKPVTIWKLNLTEAQKASLEALSGRISTK